MLRMAAGIGELIVAVFVANMLTAMFIYGVRQMMAAPSDDQIKIIAYIQVLLPLCLGALGVYTYW